MKRAMHSADPLATIPSPARAGDPLVTLEKIFGYKHFRPGQAEVVEALLAGKDCQVIWSTGAGKSVCYQLPAFHSGRSVIVVSPLISLMQDQVAALNSKCAKRVATFLGSSQLEAVDGKVRAGEFLLVYVTPEKASSEGFHSILQSLHSSQKLAAIAIDEAHCVSEWGHDFRPSYRGLHELRNTAPGIPVIALTATATARVREDICTALQLHRGPERFFQTVATVYRPNLNLIIKRKQGVQADLANLATHLSEHSEATIVYAPTVAEVETIARFLQERLQSRSVEVGIYHAQMPLAQREETHWRFLSGVLNIVVATVAFGMGIDKPDLRRVVHYGPPKTFEEYYQQIGRAGRDGLSAHCVMLFSDNDFNKYRSEFYMKGLSDEQKQVRERSLVALRGYAESGISGQQCLWLQVCQFFNEAPPFSSCSGCSACCAGSLAQSNIRDFTDEVTHICRVLASANRVSKNQLLPLLKGQRKDIPVHAAALSQLSASYASLGKRARFLEEMIPAVIQSGFVMRETRTSEIRGFERSYDVYALTDKGRSCLGKKVQILLPAPAGLLEQERLEEERKQKVTKELEQSGVDLSLIPQGELDAGQGPTLSAHQNWCRTLKHLRDSESGQSRADALEALLGKILEWRSQAAMESRLAPHHILPEHLAKAIAYSQPRTREGLEALGVRVRLDELRGLLCEQLKTLQLQPETPVDEDHLLFLPEGKFVPKQKWAYAVYKMGAKGKPPNWDVSYRRFCKGEHPEAIAAQQESAKPIKTSTVVTHLLTALLHGRPLDLRRIADVCEPPRRRAWEKVAASAAAAAQDPTAATFVAKDVLRSVLGEKVDIDWGTKTEMQKAEEEMWYSHIRWYQHLLAVGFQPTFDSESAKRLKSA